MRFKVTGQTAALHCGCSERDTNVHVSMPWRFASIHPWAGAARGARHDDCWLTGRDDVHSTEPLSLSVALSGDPLQWASSRGERACSVACGVDRAAQACTRARVFVACVGLWLASAVRVTFSLGLMRCRTWWGVPWYEVGGAHGRQAMYRMSRTVVGGWRARSNVTL